MRRGKRRRAWYRTRNRWRDKGRDGGQERTRQKLLGAVQKGEGGFGRSSGNKRGTLQVLNEVFTPP